MSSANGERPQRPSPRLEGRPPGGRTAALGRSDYRWGIPVGFGGRGLVFPKYGGKVTLIRGAHLATDVNDGPSVSLGNRFARSIRQMTTYWWASDRWLA